MDLCNLGCNWLPTQGLSERESADRSRGNEAEGLTEVGEGVIESAERRFDGAGKLAAR